MRPPVDTGRLAELSQAAAARQAEVGPRELALLAHRFGELQWHSSMLCEAFGGAAASAVSEASAAEWLAVLHYFVGAGHYHPVLCEKAAAWAQGHAKLLHLHQVEVLATALAHFGHLNMQLGEQIASAMELAPDAATDKGLTVKIAVALAVAGVEQPVFYQRALDLMTRDVAALGGSTWNAHRLLLLARSEASRPEVVLGVVRGLEEASEVAPLVPPHLLPGVVRQLHRAALRQEALLLDARPLAAALACAIPTVVGKLPASCLAGVAAGLGFFGVVHPRAAEALWKRAEETPGAWEAATLGSMAEVRMFAHLAWAACTSAVLSLAEATVVPTPDQGQLLALLAAVDPEVRGVRRVSQELRQVALSLPLFAASKDGGRSKAVAGARPWVEKVQCAFFVSRRRRAQARLLRVWTRHLRSRGVDVEVPTDSASIKLSAGAGMPAWGPSSVTVWAKHPLLLVAATEAPGEDGGGAAEQGCPLSGFEALQRHCEAESQLVLVRSDASSEDIKAAADELLDTILGRATLTDGA